jgi:hypothetical protein
MHCQMVPMKKAQDAGVKGLAWVPMFGLGVAIWSLVIAAVVFTLRGKMPPLHVKATMGPGLISGLFWNSECAWESPCRCC